MAAQYLNWLTELFEEAQVPFNDTTAGYLDASLRRIANLAEGASEEQVYRRLRERWLNQGQPGRQLLAGFVRDEFFSRRDSPFRPKEGDAYFTNAWAVENMKH